MPKVNKSNKSSLQPASALFITLFFLSDAIELMFNCHERTLARVCKRTLTALWMTFEGEQEPLTPSQLVELKNPANVGTFLEDVVGIVDGTVIQAARSKLKYSFESPDTYFNANKRQAALNMLVIVNYQGRILWNTKVYPGSKSGSIDIWNKEKI